jgi:hypothetical protein
MAALVAFPAHALLVLEERLKEHQADGTLDSSADVTELALRLLVISVRQGSPSGLTDPSGPV